MKEGNQQVGDGGVIEIPDAQAPAVVAPIPVEEDEEEDDDDEDAVTGVLNAIRRQASHLLSLVV